jgi:PAS domain S-box-containing protein
MAKAEDQKSKAELLEQIEALRARVSDLEKRSADKAQHRGRQAFLLIGEASVNASDISDFCERVVAGLAKVMGFRSGSLHLYDPESRQLVVSALCGVSDEVARDVFQDIGIDDESMVAARTARVKEAIFASDTSVDPWLSQIPERTKRFNAQSAISWPLTNSNKDLLGVLQFWTEQAVDLDENDKVLFEVIANTFALVLERYQVQDKYFAERQRLTSLLEMMPAYICLLAEDHSIRFANRKFRENFGNPKGRCCYQLINQRSQPCRPCRTFEVFANHEPLEWERELPDGTVHRVYDYPFSDVDGSFLVLELAIDITQIRLAENRLRESESRYRAVVEGQTELIFRFAPDGLVTFSNEPFARYLGLNKVEAIGENWFSRLPEDDAKKLQTDLSAVSKENPLVRIEHRVIDSKGHVRWYQWTYRAIYELEGSFEEFQAVGQDIDERITTARLLEKERNFLANMIKLNPYSIQVLDKEGYPIMTNDAYFELFGSFPPKGYNVFSDPLFANAGAIEDLVKIRQGGVIRLDKGLWYDPQKIRPDVPSRKLCIKVVMFPIMGEDGQPERFVSMHEDITQTRIAEAKQHEALLRAQKADMLKSRFLSNMSHEIRSPLNTINGLSTLLLIRKTIDDSQKERYLGLIKKSGESLLQMIDRILDLAKIESGKLQPTHTPFDLSDLIQSFSERYQLPMAEKNLSYTMNWDSTIRSQIAGDPIFTEQILTNLIENAIKFTHEGSIALNVKVEKQTDLNQTLIFAVEDTGIGIEKEKLDMIFESFYQIDGSAAREYPGAGLGLSIIRELAKQLGGTVEVESHLGQGTTFRFICEFESQIRS